MKKLILMGSIALLVIVILMVLANTVFAQTQPEEKKNVIHFSAEKGKNTEMVLTAPGHGENLTVIVDVPVPKSRKAVAPAPTYITNVHQGSNLQLRWGVGMNILMLVSAAAPELTAITVGLVGEIGYSDSPWRLQGRANLGKCEDDYLAVGGELAALRRLTRRFWAGVGGGVLYCADTDTHPRELGKRRLVGAAAKAVYEEEYTHSAVAVELSLGLDLETVPVPDGRANDMAGSIGLSVSYLF